MARILVVDDDSGIRELLKVILESEDHTVKVAIDGVHALALCENEEFDLVVSDYMMPRMTGPEFFRALRQRGKMMPVIIVSGEDSEDLDKLMKGGISGWIPKPFKNEVFIDLVRTQLTIWLSHPRFSPQSN